VVRNGSLKFLCWLGFMMLGYGTLLAATVTVTTDRDTVVLNETFQLVFTVQGEQTGEPDFSPLNQDFQLLGTSSSSQISMINGNTTQSKTYTLRLAPRHAGDLAIPPIIFGNDQSAPNRMQVTENKTAVPDAPGAEDVLKITAGVDVANPYVQQQVLLTVKIYRRINWQQAALSELDAGGNDLLIQRLGEDKHYRTTQDGKNWEVIERRFALFPQHSGELEINPFTLSAAVVDERQSRGRSSNDPFDRFFSRRPTVQKTARSDAIRLQVKPVAESLLPWLAARDLRLQENWSEDTDQLRVGASVTRTIAIIADGVSVGQLPPLKPASVAGIKRYPDQPQTNEQASSQGLLSTSSQKFALIPTRAGEFEIPPLEIDWWNISADRMETALLPGRTIKVSGAAVAAVQPTPPAQEEQAPKPENKPTAALPKPDDSLDRWLLASNGILLLLWLVTLFAWWRGMRVRQPSPVQAPGTQSDPARRELLKMLNRAATEKDGTAARDVILQLAKTIWPDDPPVSLTRMADLVERAVAEELNSLQRSLYAVDQVDWDGSLIARALSGLKPQKNTSPSQQSGLKSMYPGS